MNSDRFWPLVDRQPLQHHVMQEFRDVVQLERGGGRAFLDPEHTGRGIEHNWILSVAAGLEQRLLDFPPLGVSLRRQSFAFKGLAATQCTAVLGQDHLESGLAQQSRGLHR